MRNYKNYEIWKKAHSLVLEIYKATSAFPKNETYGLTSQLRRAASSIPINIVEGSSRKSDKEFLQFLYIAASSAGETEYILQLAIDLELMNSDKGELLVEKTNHTRRMIYSFIKSISK